MKSRRIPKFRERKRRRKNNGRRICKIIWIVVIHIGKSAGYQARKKAVTTNSIFLSDNIRTNDSNGGSKAGNYNDLYEI